MTGQYIIRRTGEYVNTQMKQQFGDKKNYVVYTDTDSVVGDTLVYVNGEKIAISDLFDSINEYVRRDEDGRDYVKPVEKITTLSFNTDKQEIEEKPIKYVMKHRVKKRMFKITVDGKSVTVTEDHSIIVKRGSTYLSVSPKNIVNGDVVVYI